MWTSSDCTSSCWNYTWCQILLIVQAHAGTIVDDDYKRCYSTEFCIIMVILLSLYASEVRKVQTCCYQFKWLRIQHFDRRTQIQNIQFFSSLALRKRWLILRLGFTLVRFITWLGTYPTLNLPLLIWRACCTIRVQNNSIDHSINRAKLVFWKEIGPSHSCLKFKNQKSPPLCDPTSSAPQRNRNLTLPLRYGVYCYFRATGPCETLIYINSKSSTEINFWQLLTLKETFETEKTTWLAKHAKPSRLFWQRGTSRKGSGRRLAVWIPVRATQFLFCIPKNADG
jgi:hypothetical protein